MTFLFSLKLQKQKYRRRREMFIHQICRLFGRSSAGGGNSLGRSLSSLGRDGGWGDLASRLGLHGFLFSCFGFLGLSNRHGGGLLLLLSDVGWSLSCSGGGLRSSNLLGRSCGRRLRTLLHGGGLHHFRLSS